MTRLDVFGYRANAYFRQSNKCQLDCQEKLDRWICRIRNIVQLLGIKAYRNPKPYGLLGSDWSKSFNIERGTDNTSLSLRGTVADVQKREYELGMRVKLAPAPFTRSRIITLDTWYYLTNRTNAALDVRQDKQHHWLCLKPLETRAFNFLRTTPRDEDSDSDIAMEKCICIRWTNLEEILSKPDFEQPYWELEGKWTVPFGISEIQERHVQMRGHVAEVLHAG